MALIGIFVGIGVATLLGIAFFRNLGELSETNKHVPVFLINVVMAFVCFFWMWGHVESVHPGSPWWAKLLCSLFAFVFGLAVGILIIAVYLLFWFMGWDMT
jgi:hypothetical protein